MYEKVSRINSLEAICRQTFVDLLDNYISANEKRYERIDTNRETSRREKLCQCLKQLKSSLRREKRHRIKAYEYLNVTNNTMRKTIAELHDGLKTCRGCIRNEFKKIEDADTARLLNIDPISIL